MAHKPEFMFEGRFIYLLRLTDMVYLKEVYDDEPLSKKQKQNIVNMFCHEYQEEKLQFYKVWNDDYD